MCPSYRALSMAKSGKKTRQESDEFCTWGLTHKQGSPEYPGQFKGLGVGDSIKSIAATSDVEDELRVPKARNAERIVVTLLVYMNNGRLEVTRSLFDWSVSSRLQDNHDVGND